MKSTPEEGFTKKLTKFQKTPSPRIESQDRSDNMISERNNSSLNTVEILQNFLNKEMSKIEEGDHELMDKIDLGKIEKLSEELVQVFDFDNVDNTSLIQKEELVNKVFLLGGEIIQMRILEEIFYP